MTHWSPGGTNFIEGHNVIGAELLWGEPPAAMIEEGIQRLIGRLYSELRRHPTVAEIDEQVYGLTAPPEIVEGIAKAARVFREDLGRYPTRMTSSPYHHGLF